MDSLQEELVKCRYCEQLNSVNAITCKKCGVQLTEKPFLTDFQLEPCVSNCGNPTVHLKAKKCPDCDKYQRRNFRQRVKAVIADFYEFIFVSKNNGMTVYQQLFMYSAIILGVYCSNSLRHGEPPSSQGLSSDFIIAGLASLLVMPNVYEKVSFKPNTPTLIKFAIYFQSGVFADNIIEGLEREVNDASFLILRD
jgi:hypothetical protein